MLVREHLDEILSQQYPEATPDLIAKVQALVESVAGEMTPEQAERLADKFRWAFGLQETAVSTRPTRPQESLEAIVEGSWFGRYLEYTEESESPACFHFGAAMATVAAGLGRQPTIAWDATPLFPNMYTLLIGPTGAKKSSALKRALSTVGVVMQPTLLPNEGTHQGFAHALKLQGDATGTAQGFIVVSEFASMMKADHNTKRLIQWLTDWYDCGDHWERGLRSEEVYALDNVCVNMIGASQIPWLRDLPPDAITGGYFPRHLVFYANATKPRRAFPRFNANLEAELQRQLGRLRTQELPQRVTFTREAMQYIERWYEIELAHEYATADSEQFQAWLDRKQAHLMKIAVVWQFVESGPAREIQAETVHRARRVVDYCDESVRVVYGAMGVSKEGQAADDVVKLLRKHRELRQTKIIRVLRNRYKAFQIKEALDTLEKSGEATRSLDTASGAVWRMRE